MEVCRVIKIGGNIVDNEPVLQDFLTLFASLEGPRILIHGGGKIATKISKALGIETQMVEGRRVTDAETLDVVTMVYAGLVNKKVVAGLQANGVNAIGLSGADANVIRSHKRMGSAIDYGFVADVDEVDSAFLKALLDGGRVPVMAPITHDRKGLLLNTNADTVAAEVAKACSRFYETELVYCFELPGVLRDRHDETTLIPAMNPNTYAQLKDDGIIVEGMIPKLDNCFQALESGVHQVRICHAMDLGDKSTDFGTILTK